MRIILNLSFVIFLSQLNPHPQYTPHPTFIHPGVSAHIHTLAHAHTLTQQEADSRRSERDLTMTLQCCTPTASSSAEVTAQPADVLAVNYSDNAQLPIVSAAVRWFR